MWGRTAGVSIAGAVLALLVAGADTGGGLDDTGLADDAAAIATHLDPRVRDTLARIPDLGRRLLALRSYLRAGSTLPARWSWSEQEIREFEQSQESCDAQAEVDRVVAAFAAAFPGHTLYVNRQVRSLDLQIERWNTNASVDAASRTLLDDLRRASMRRSPGKGADWLQDSLTGWTLAVPVTLAAPGLSAHGQSRAFDFQVERDGTIVAGTEAEHATRDWDAAGWTERLKQIVARSSTRLRGPLETPREPWHYYYETGVSAPAESVHGRCE
jgi:hypothetical protein